MDTKRGKERWDELGDWEGYLHNFDIIYKIDN